MHGGKRKPDRRKKVVEETEDVASGDISYAVLPFSSRAVYKAEEEKQSR